MRRESALNDGCLTIGLMVKYWESGKVKTRLGASIGMRRAAQIHRLFVGQLCRKLNHSGDRRSISLSPIDRKNDLLSMLNSHLEEPDWTVVAQGGGDLGDRMMTWFAQTLPARGSRSLLMGGDYPTIDPEWIARADGLLVDHDVVLGPAIDGGYYLIGLKGDWSQRGETCHSLFRDIPWSTSEVLDLTRTRARDAGLAVAELDLGEDIDTIVELENLIERLRDRDPELRAAIQSILAAPEQDDRP